MGEVLRQAGEETRIEITTTIKKNMLNTPKVFLPDKQNSDIGNGCAQHIASDAEFNASLAAEMNKRIAKMGDKDLDLATRSAEARKFIDWHVEHMRHSWTDWMDESTKILEDLRRSRLAIGSESDKLLKECGDVRKFFLSDLHDEEIKRLREFVDLAERLQRLKANGTLDALADTILKLA